MIPRNDMFAPKQERIDHYQWQAEMYEQVADRLMAMGEWDMAEHWMRRRDNALNNKAQAAC